MDTLRERLARRIKGLMEKHPDLDTQVKVAAKAGVSQSTVARVLSQEVGASVDVIDDIGRAFGLRPSRLILSDEDEAELLKVWLALAEIDRDEVLHFAQVLARRSAPQPRPTLDFEERKENPGLTAATLKASARPPTNGTPESNRKGRRKSA